jgi:hypothetical protein
MLASWRLLDIAQGCSPIKDVLRLASLPLNFTPAEDGESLLGTAWLAHRTWSPRAMLFAKRRFSERAIANSQKASRWTGRHQCIYPCATCYARAHLARATNTARGETPRKGLKLFSEAVPRLTKVPGSGSTQQQHSVCTGGKPNEQTRPSRQKVTCWSTVTVYLVADVNPSPPPKMIRWVVESWRERQSANSRV